MNKKKQKKSKKRTKKRKKTKKIDKSFCTFPPPQKDTTYVSYFIRISHGYIFFGVTLFSFFLLSASPFVLFSSGLPLQALSLSLVVFFLIFFFDFFFDFFFFFFISCLFFVFRFFFFFFSFSFSFFFVFVFVFFVWTNISHKVLFLLLSFQKIRKKKMSIFISTLGP